MPSTRFLRARAASFLLALGAVPMLPVQSAAEAAQVGPEAPLPAVAAAAPQDSARWRWGVLLGLGLHQMRDDLLAPLRYAGPALDARVRLGRAGEAAEQQAELRIGLALGLNRYDHLAAALPFGASYVHLRPVTLPALGTDTRLMVGAAAIVRTDDMYFIDWDDAHLYWLTSYGVGPAATLRREMGEGRSLAASLEIPLAGLVGRPDEGRRNKVDDLVFLRTWLVGPSRHLRFAAPPELIILDGRLAYGRSRRIRFLYDVSLRTTPEPQRAVILEQLLGVEWTFGRW